MQNNYDSENVLIVRIGCKKHDVDVDTVISLMQATLSMVRAANHTVCPKEVLQVKVSPFVPGSFEILYHLFVPQGIFLLEKTPIIASTFAICKDYLSVRKWFHGKPQPKTIEPGIVLHGDMKIEVNAETVNVYNNSQVTQNFGRAFTEIQKDDTIKEIEFYSGVAKRKLLAKIPVTNFVDFIPPDNVETEISPEKKENVARTFVTIHTPVLAKTVMGKKRSKWKVVYNNRIISVDIQDETFRQDVDSTIYRFGVGDKLEVDITEKKVFNEDINEFIVNNAGYVITKVWGHVPQKKQTLSQNPSQDKQKSLFGTKKKPRKK
jgi:hypothetical protein